MKRLGVAGTVVLMLMMVVSVAFAHHSAAGIDQTKTVTVEGIVKQFKWANPHSWLEMEVVNSKGGTDLWNFEMMPPSYLIPNGWKSTTVKAGDKVKVTARPFKDGSPGGLFMNVTLASGQVLGQTAPRGGAPAGAPAGGAPPAQR